MLRSNTPQECWEHHADNTFNVHILKTTSSHSTAVFATMFLYIYVTISTANLIVPGLWAYLKFNPSNTNKQQYSIRELRPMVRYRIGLSSLKWDLGRVEFISHF